MHTAEGRAISATLGALTARLSPDLGKRVRASLPAPIARATPTAPFQGAFDAAEFYAHVGELEDVDPVTAVDHARDACRVIAENLPLEVVAAMQRQLGPELAPLLVHDDERSELALDSSPVHASRRKMMFIAVMVGIASAALALALGMAALITRMR